ncbi:hypothetical protein AQZ52_07830 [Novosphingobium fuchskuhlense]|uniref:Uncharacterized protein n=1 Tax=Novosphingobium fuchskuhlense TaxID=1117702 RepID=A0A124JW87_9SPHN|nr:hypothetical protein [Novosphingobium fuchskuhlense]KUR73084.1 hypothetical protein AQZ52_07830 [Novosphingobium fuchskuhlense]
MLTLALLLSATQADPPPPPPPAPVPCADAGGLLPGSGLCRAEALARLPRGPWAPLEGCDVAAQEVQLTGGRWLLYAAQRCGEKAARLAVTPQQGGALVLRYAEAARNTELVGRKALAIAIGRPAAEHLAVYTLASAGLPQPQARRCALRTPPSAGYPRDAFVYDLAADESRRSAALDLPCGPYGRSAWPGSYWRLFSGIGVFYLSAGDRPEFDPASLTVYTPQT